MENKQFGSFCAAVRAVTDMYKDLSDETLQIWWMVLKDFEFDEILFALKQFVSDPKKSSFMPKPGDLMLYLNADPEANALDAWTKLERNIKSLGSYDSVFFDDGIIHAVVVDMGGWIHICRHPLDKLALVQKEFTQRYVSYARTKRAVWLPHLVGIVEQQNGKFEVRCAHGCDKEKADQVRQLGNFGNNRKSGPQQIFLSIKDEKDDSTMEKQNC